MPRDARADKAQGFADFWVDRQPIFGVLPRNLERSPDACKGTWQRNGCAVGLEA